MILVIVLFLLLQHHTSILSPCGPIFLTHMHTHMSHDTCILKLHVVLQQCKSKMKQGVIEKLVEHHSDPSCMRCCSVGITSTSSHCLITTATNISTYSDTPLKQQNRAAPRGVWGGVVVMLLRHRLAVPLRGVSVGRGRRVLAVLRVISIWMKRIISI